MPRGIGADRAGPAIGRVIQQEAAIRSRIDRQREREGRGIADASIRQTLRKRQIRDDAVGCRVRVELPFIMAAQDHICRRAGPGRGNRLTLFDDKAGQTRLGGARGEDPKGSNTEKSSAESHSRISAIMLPSSNYASSDSP
jgi:hypothetical protein